MFYYFDPWYFIFISPAVILMFWAQSRVKSSYARGMRVSARLSGAAAARHILDQAGCQNVGIEETRGRLSDHYDPRSRVLRLSGEVYHGNSAASVGIAAHEAGHALQHAQNYAPLVIRNAAVPAARFGPGLFMVLLIVGMLVAGMGGQQMGFGLIVLGLLAYCGLAVFQIVNLPVEFDASNRAKQILTEYNIVDQDGAVAVRDVLNAAGWTYVAATLQTLLTVAYYALMIFGGRRD